MFTVHEGRRLLYDGKPVPFHASPNFNRSYRITPAGILLHDTAGHAHGNDAVAHFMKPSAQASAHFIITDEDEPRVIQMVDLDRRAWHAGRSEWNGLPDCNSRFIGIELCNPGRLWGDADGAYPEGFRTKFTVAEHGIQQIDSELHGRKGAWWKPYSAKQIDLLHDLVTALGREFSEITEIVGHCQVAPGRKVDPTPIMYRDHLDALAQTLRQAALRPPELAPLSRQLSQQRVSDIQEQLNDLGYGPILEDGLIGVKTGGALWAFQAENNLEPTGKADAATLKALFASEARPAPIAGRQAVQKQDLVKSDPDAAAGNTQAWLGQLQLGLAAASAVMALLADLGKHVATVVATYGGETVVMAAVTLLAWFGLNNWTAGRALLSRAYQNWIGGTSNVTLPPEKHTAQEG